MNMDSSRNPDTSEQAPLRRDPTELVEVNKEGTRMNADEHRWIARRRGEEWYPQIGYRWGLSADWRRL